MAFDHSPRASAGRAPVILADDLSGAAEAAAAALGAGWPTARVLLDPLGLSDDHGAVQVLDLNTRGLDPSAAAVAAERAFDQVGRAPMIKKVDSLLRGNLEAELRPAVRRGKTIVLSPALPSQGRTVLNGVLHVGDLPLHQTHAWATEAVRPPRRVRDAVGDLPTVNVDLDQLRSGAWTAVLTSPTPQVVICDAQADEDLDAIVDGADRDDVLLAGSSDLVRRWLGGSEQVPDASGSERSAADPAGSPQRVLGVIGSTAAAVAPQLAHAVDRTGVVVHLLDMTDLLAGDEDFLARSAVELTEFLARTDVCVAPGASPALDRQQQRRVARSLAEVVVRAVGATDRTALFLTGGETARAVLDRLPARCLAVHGEVHHGAVLSRTESGRLVATRPGSFGHEASITDILQALRGAHAPNERTNHDSDH